MSIYPYAAGKRRLLAIFVRRAPSVSIYTRCVAAAQPVASRAVREEVVLRVREEKISKYTYIHTCLSSAVSGSVKQLTIVYVGWFVLQKKVKVKA
ncbi:unnamed protein product [Ceratitis capitata]|uniref:(Mediterranean fruit fly) hypothetical protein n=1 Tax=Ceratitis capitata TaxID=7213 RepID=A0A811UBZ1_CERCA|nr:unnamed protein product [Ceratitis capitata]